MKPDYDDLTPAQKAKYTRTFNRIDDARCSAYQIQWEVYSKKQKALYAEIEAEIKQLQEEERAKVAELKAEIKRIETESSEKVWAMQKKVRQECEPEFLEYEKARELATLWRDNKWAEAKIEFWKELGYTYEEVTA